MRFSLVQDASALDSEVDCEEQSERESEAERRTDEIARTRPECWGSIQSKHMHQSNGCECTYLSLRYLTSLDQLFTSTVNYETPFLAVMWLPASL